jgi:hypothetical protein
MKETILRSKSNKNLYLQILDGSFGLLDDKETEMITDNSSYAYEIFKLLKKADEMGAFDKFEEEEVADEILV